SITRSVPNSPTSPVSTLNGWPASATSSPLRNTVGARRCSSSRASCTACEKVSSRVAGGALSVDMLGHLARVGIGRLERVGDRLGDLGLDLLAQPLDRLVVAEARGDEQQR